MYIQPKREENAPPPLPEGYSGSAFLPTTAPQATEEAEAPISEPITEKETAQPENEAVSVQAVAAEEQKQEAGGVFARIPLLSALLPPKRGKKEGGDLPEWVLIAAVFLLLFADGEENDILPFLLLLLLWD